MDANAGTRLAQWRSELALTQAALSQRTGIHVGQLKKYETGRSMPGGEALAAIALTGVNINWLLTGEGPMRAAAVTAAPSRPPVVFNDIPRLQATVAAVEEGLQSIGRKLPPDKYAELVAAAYNLMGESSPHSAGVVQFIKAAA